MERGDRRGVVRAGAPDTAVAGDLEIPIDQRLGCWRAQRDDHSRLDDRQLGVEPGAAGTHLAGPRGAIDLSPALDRRGPVLDDVGEVELAAIEAGLLQRAVEHFAGGTNERPPDLVLGLARPLPDDHDRRVGIALAPHRLRGADVEVAAGAAGGLGRQAL